MYAWSQPIAYAPIRIPSMIWCGVSSSSMWSLNVPGSASSQLHTM